MSDPRLRDSDPTSSSTVIPDAVMDRETSTIRRAWASHHPTRQAPDTAALLRREDVVIEDAKPDRGYATAAASFPRNQRPVPRAAAPSRLTSSR
jgi:hypothetical protein